MGECDRFQALGCSHPKQGCYLLCQTECVQTSEKLGFGFGEASASAAMILGATGVDTTAGGKNRCHELVFSLPTSVSPPCLQACLLLAYERVSSFSTTVLRAPCPSSLYSDRLDAQVRTCLDARVTSRLHCVYLAYTSRIPTSRIPTPRVYLHLAHTSRIRHVAYTSPWQQEAQVFAGKGSASSPTDGREVVFAEAATRRVRRT